MLFLTSELANEAEITILSARDTARAWVPGRCIMGRDIGVYKTGYNTWLSSKMVDKIPWALAMQAISFYLAFAQYFVTLYRGGSRQAVPK